MNEGYQRRPEERAFDRLWAAFVCVMFCAIGELGGVLILLRDCNQLRAENAALTKQLDYHTCRVQYEPSPMPEPTNQSPTLIEDEPRPLTEEEFTELQNRLKEQSHED